MVATPPGKLLYSYDLITRKRYYLKVPQEDSSEVSLSILVLEIVVEFIYYMIYDGSNQIHHTQW